MNITYFISITAVILFSVDLIASESSTIEIDTNNLQKGILLTFQLKDMPVNILSRRENEILNLKNSYLSEPSAPVINCSMCDPVLRSISREVLVTWGYNPDTGCKLIYVSSEAEDWKGYKVHRKGGFVDKCNMSQYDLSGRIIDGPNDASIILHIPNYKFNNGIIIFNED